MRLGQFQHAMMSRPTHDERGREAFLATMRRTILTDLYPGNERLYAAALKPAFAAAHGRDPQSYIEVKGLMQDCFFYKMFGMLNRGTQELLWDTVGESIERQLPRLKQAVKEIPPAGGTLVLAPDLVLPAYATSVDIHVMPGGFHTERDGEDVFAGALYDRGVYVYAYGGLGPQNDALGRSTAGFIRDKFPDLRPRRILELGCGIGSATLPLAEAFPDAEIFGVDLAAPMLRYGHARAEALGVPIHFSQANAVATNFPDGHFDLVVSVLLFHEIPQAVARQILVEAHRLLAPGGITVHNDMVGWPTEPFQAFMAEWNVLNNNEPFERGSGTLPWQAFCVAAGFPPETVFIEPIVSLYLQEQLAFVGFRGAVKT